MLDRMRKDQLDGIVSGGMLCQKLSPSMRVLRLVGLFQTRDESGYVAGRLKPIFDEDFRKEGFVNLGDVGIGPDLFFSRKPIRSMEDLKQARLWIWNLDETFLRTLADAWACRWWRCRSSRPTPRLRRAAHRRLHRRAVGGAGVSVVDRGALRDRPARRLSARLRAHRRRAPSIRCRSRRAARC